MKIFSLLREDIPSQVKENENQIHDVGDSV